VKYSAALALALASSLTGCATLMNSRTQQVALDTVPTGAICDVAGVKVRTPAIFTVSRDASHPYDVACALEGYKTATGQFTIHFSDVGDFIFGNIIMGGVIPGMIVDSQGGAYAVKPERMLLTMEPAATK
jgi:hypothetical protein